MKKKTVMQVIPRLELGGTERAVVDVSAALCKAGMNSIVVSFGGSLVAAVERGGGKHILAPVHLKKPWVIYNNIKLIRSFIREYGVDVLHVRSRAPAISCYFAARAEGVPMVTTVHAAYGLGWPKKIRRWYNSFMVRAARVICISSFIKGYVTSHYNVDENRLRVVLRGIDQDLFHNGAVTQARLINTINKWSLPDPNGGFIVMMPARLHRLKGHALLIEAVAKIKKKIFLVFPGRVEGREAYVEELRAHAENLGVPGCLYFVGQTSDMPAAYKAVDIVVSASTVPEGFGRTVVEAQLMEKVVVAPSYGGAMEQIVDGKTGFLFEPSDVDSLSEALLKAVSLAEGDRKVMVQDARENALRKFSTKEMCRQVLAVYDEVLSERA